MKTLTLSLTALMLALIASTASANEIWLQVAPGDTPTPGGTVEIQMLSDVDISWWRIEGITGPAGTSVSNPYVHPLAGNPSTFNAMPGYVDNYTQGDVTYLVWKWFCESNRGVAPAGDVILSFDLTIHDTWDGVTPFTLDLLGDGELYYYDGGSLEMEWNPHGIVSAEPSQINMPIADLTIVPEPATMAMLGLGGLFLRKRRKTN